VDLDHLVEQVKPGSVRVTTAYVPVYFYICQLYKSVTGNSAGEVGGWRHHWHEVNNSRVTVGKNEGTFNIFLQIDHKLFTTHSHANLPPCR